MTVMHIHDLDGCAPTPLAHYLKALGILRLVAEQADPGARGWWDGERFRLMTRLTREELEGFFLERYEPTPLVSPWNKGSGYFYPNDPGLSPAEHAIAPRFGRLVAGIKAGRALLDELGNADAAVRAIKDETKDKKLSRDQRDQLKKSEDYKKKLTEAEKRFKSLKAELIPRIRLSWRGPHREWLDAAMVLDDNGEPRFPAILGTGGNDGRLDFTNNFYQRLNDVFDLAHDAGLARPPTACWFANALWNTPTTSQQAGSPVGQYFPGAAGGANNSNGPDANSQLNPVDFILMLEGTILFTAHATKRLGALEVARAASPFAIGGQGAGYASASDADESARGEQWMPLWSNPLTLAELQRILAEGRAQNGARAAREPLDLARAIARLGTARGISAFQRFGYIERNGQSNFAVPLGRFRVPHHIDTRISCLDDLDVWLPHLRRAARDQHAPARLRIVERQLGDALLAVTQHPDEPWRWQVVLLALAAVEAVQVSGSGIAAGPIPRLRPAWIQAIDHTNSEVRLAVACALQAWSFTHDRLPVDGIRRHWLPLAKGRFATSVGPDVVMEGRSGLADAISLVERRLVEATQHGQRCLPLVAARGTSATASDLSAMLAGAVDLDRTLAMARALMAINHREWASAPRLPDSEAGVKEYPDDAWMAIRLALLPWKLPDGRQIGADPAIFRRLVSGDAVAATDLALRRLSGAGIRTTVRTATVSHETARRWAAALAFPINPITAQTFLHRLELTHHQGA